MKKIEEIKTCHFALYNTLALLGITRGQAAENKKIIIKKLENL